jgi:hypothetical protein
MYRACVCLHAGFFGTACRTSSQLWREAKPTIRLPFGRTPCGVAGASTGHARCATLHTRQPSHSCLKQVSVPLPTCIQGTAAADCFPVDFPSCMHPVPYLSGQARQAPLGPPGTGLVAQKDALLPRAGLPLFSPCHFWGQQLLLSASI